MKFRVVSALLLVCVLAACTVTSYSDNLDRELTLDGRAYLARHRVEWVVDGDVREAPDAETMGVAAGPTNSFDLITVEAKGVFVVNEPMLQFFAYTYGLISGWWPAFLIPMSGSSMMEARITRYDGSYEIQTWEHYAQTETIGFLSWVLWVFPGYEYGKAEPGELKRHIFVTMVNRLAEAEAEAGS